MKVKSPFLIKPHSKVRLAHFDPSATPGCDNEQDSKRLLDKDRDRLEKLQEVLYASQKKALLVVLQGMDTSGKDGTIRHIFSGVNPQGCQVAAFKVPTPLEQRHDFLWRCHEQVPPRGMIGIFNRSHYEDILSPRVHGLIDGKTARRRMDEIVAWEEMLADNGVVILKFFLHISQQEQTERLQARIDDPAKHWKLSPADFKERLFWDKYQAAYEDAITHTSRKHAPWFVIPADHKWYRNIAISEVIVDALDSLKLEYPAPTFDPNGMELTKNSDSDAKAAKKAGKRKNKRGLDVEKDTVETGRRK